MAWRLDAPVAPRRRLARMLPGRRLSSLCYARGIEPMQDAPFLLHLLHAALMVSSMMLTWQVHRLRQPSPDDNRTLGR